MIHWLVRSQVYIASGAGLLAAGALVRFGDEPWRLTTLWVFLATLVYYNLARSSPAVPTAEPLLRHGVVLVLALVVVVMAVWLNPEQRLLVVTLGVLGLLYLLPIISHRAGSLRQIGLLKVPLVGLVWAGMTAGLPALASTALPEGWWWVILERFAFVCAIMLPFEMRDRRLDRSAGLRTVAHVLRPMWLRRLGVGLLIVSLAVSVWSPVGRSATAWSTVVLAHVLAGVLTLYATPQSEALCDIGLDGTLLILAAGCCLS